MPVNRQKLCKALGIGTAAALAVILLALCGISGVLMMMSGLPTGALPYMGLIAIALGVLVGGYIAAAITGSRGLVMGLCCGAAVFVCLLIAGMSTGNFQPGTLTAAKLGVCALFGALGGIKGVNRKEKLHIK